MGLNWKCERIFYVFIVTLLGIISSLCFCQGNCEGRRSQWPRGLRRRSAAARLLRLWVRIPPGACMSVCCECCVLSGRGLCDELITCPEESYRLWCVIVCDLETSWMRRRWPTGGLLRQKQTIVKEKPLSQHTFLHLYLYFLPDDGRMKRPKHVVGK